MAQTGRADLLLALHQGVQDGLALEHDDRHWWGYAPIPKAPPPAPSEPPLEFKPPERPGPPAPTTEAEPLRPPLQMPFAWRLREQTARDLPQELRGLPELTEADLRPLAADPLPYQDLVPWARALPGLRRHTDRQVPGAVHWPRLADLVARRTMPRRLPRRQWQRWPPHVTLVLDFSPRLDAYRWDFHRLAMQLDAQLPSESLSVRVLQHGPGGPWLAWRHPRKPERRADLQEWETQARLNSLVLVASDLGLFDPQPATRDAWAGWGNQLREQGARVLALAPVSPAQITAQAQKHFELLRWSPDSRWRLEPHALQPLPTEPAQEADDEPLSTLVALAATALRIDPPLLRAWRTLLPGGGDAGLEGRLWNHPHLQPATLTCATRDEHLDADLARHAHLPPALRAAARALHEAQHAHLRRSLGCAEGLRWEASSSRAARAEPLAFVKRLLHTLQEAGEAARPALRNRLLGAAELVQAAASPQVRALDPALFAALDAAAERWRSGFDFGPVAGTAEDPDVRWWALVQQGSCLKLLPAEPALCGVAFGSPVAAPLATPGVWVTSSAGLHWITLDPGGADLADLPEAPDELRISLDRHDWVLDRVSRPRWADEWRQLEGRAVAGVASPALGPDGKPEFAWFEPPVQAIAWSGVANGRVQIGLDEFGAYAHVGLRGPDERSPHAPLDKPLRFRWIPRGRFDVGSPEGIGDSDEHPQHPVHVTQGFWLAQGPCSQALWALVMGENPSHFEDAPDAYARPVEQVSFEAVQTFLQRLAPWLPAGCQPMLPTEAQWEYAARADTTTQYPWGDDPDDARANWNQQHQGTTAVGRFKANPWGLFDMHGNVWEWCDDSLRRYTREAQRDPHGDLEGPLRRAVRGGSWFHRPGSARSAYRDGGRPGYHTRFLGFRLALRSPAPGAGGPPAEPAPGPGGASAGAGRPGGDAGFLDRLASGLRRALAPRAPNKPKATKGKKKG